MILLFFFNDTATTEIYTLSLHDALPICRRAPMPPADADPVPPGPDSPGSRVLEKDRKSTRLNSSHANISYAVFCLKKKNLLLQKQILQSNTRHAPSTLISLNSYCSHLIQ